MTDSAETDVLSALEQLEYIQGETAFLPDDLVRLREAVIGLQNRLERAERALEFIRFELGVPQYLLDLAANTPQRSEEAPA